MISNYTLSVESSDYFQDKPAALKIGVSEQGMKEKPFTGRSYQIIGNVTNAGSHSTVMVQAIATFYDETGKVIGNDVEFLSPSELPAGETADFILDSAFGNRTEDIKSVKLTAESNDYVLIDPELEQQQPLQGMQQQEDNATPPTSQVTTGANITEGATSDNSGAARNALDVIAINQSTAQAIRYTEQAKIAMQNNDTQGVFGNLDLALNELESIQGNLTLTAPESSGGTNVDSNTSAEATRALSPPTPPQQQEQT